ncbi:MAG: hypothetical protein ABIQ74_09715, partial [Chitinophagales bacterium]
IDYRYKKTNYHVNVHLADDNNDPALIVDGILQSENMIQLVDDGTEHMVTIKILKGFSISKSY